MTQLLPEVRQGLREMNIIAGDDGRGVCAPTQDRPRVCHLRQAYVRSLDTIRKFLAAAKVISTGRYGGWNYSAMEDALRFGEEAARHAWELLK